MAPITIDSDSDDDEGVPATRKRKKSAALPSPTTPTFKTPGKPPRKITRRPSMDGKRSTSRLVHPSPAKERALDDNSDSDEDIMPGGRRRRTVVALDSPLTQVAKSPETLVHIVENSDDDDDDDDDDDVPGLRRRRKVMAIDSPLTQVAKSPGDLLQHDSDDDDVAVSGPKRRRRVMPLINSPLTQVLESPRGLAQRLKSKMKETSDRKVNVSGFGIVLHKCLLQPCRYPYLYQHYLF